MVKETLNKLKIEKSCIPEGNLNGHEVLKERKVVYKSLIHKKAIRTTPITTEQFLLQLVGCMVES